MMRFFRKLAIPAGSLSLVSFVGQFLLISCISLANASVTDAVSETLTQPTNCHESGQLAQPHNGAVNIPGNASGNSSGYMPCCLQHDYSLQKDETCCAAHNADQPFVSEASRKLIEYNLQQADLAALWTEPVPMPSRVIHDIPPKPGFERTRLLIPTYLSNCSFLE